MQSVKNKQLFILVGALVLVLIFAGVTVSKYVFTDEKHIVGVYTDFVLSHDGDGQTAVIRDGADGSVGYIAVNVGNFNDEKISKRNVRFMLREPTTAEIEKGSVSDAWGNAFSLDKDSDKYTVKIVDDQGNEYTEEQLKTIAFLTANERSYKTFLLKITRKADAGDFAADSVEKLSIILETSEPYKDMKVFTINATQARLSAGVASTTYQGYTEKIVNLKSAIDFVKNSAVVEGAKYKATITISLEGDVIFDAYRFNEAYGQKCETGKKEYVFTIDAGADVYMFFYVTGACSVKITGVVDDTNLPEKISGIAEDGSAFSQI